MKALNPNTGEWEDLYVKALDSFPVGVIVEYPTTDSAKLPTGYMFCDGSAISRTEYSELFSLIGTSFGAGDGSTTFNIPSKEGLVTVGIKSSDTDFDTIGETLGSKTVTLTTQQIPSHNHAMETYRQYGTGSQGDNSTKIGRTQSNADGGTANITTLNQGGGQPHNNIQPTQVSNFIIKVKPTRVLASTVVNAYNESTENAYSCDYANKAFGGKVLWTNPNPTSNFASQNVTLSSGDYDTIEIIYKGVATADSYGVVKHYMSLAGGKLIRSNTEASGVGNRDFTVVNSSTINFGSGYFNGSSNNATNVPIYIVGYKTGLFN